MVTKTLKNKLRSGFELTCAKLLESRKVKFTYESEELPYTLESKYKPDFIINQGHKIYIEVKGHFKPSDRRKMKAVKKQHPDKDIRLWFMRDNYLNTKTKANKYSDWADKNGFEYHVGDTFPKHWFTKTTKK